jgi:hypothetical protein
MWCFSRPSPATAKEKEARLRVAKYMDDTTRDGTRPEVVVAIKIEHFQVELIEKYAVPPARQATGVLLFGYDLRADIDALRRSTDKRALASGRVHFESETKVVLSSLTLQEISPSKDKDPRCVVFVVVVVACARATTHAPHPRRTPQLSQNFLRLGRLARRRGVSLVAHLSAHGAAPRGAAICGD